MMPLLSRAAENLYWLGRHLERVESAARAVQEHTNLLIDMPVEVESDWSSLVAMIGGQQLFDEMHPAGVADRTPGEDAVMSFLLHDRDNPSSVVATVTAARENLRSTRQLVPNAAWESLNRLHLGLASPQRPAARSNNLQVCDDVRTACQQLAGIVALSMHRGHGHALYELGRNLERADMTTRILDSRVDTIFQSANGPSEPADRSPFEDVRWLGMLRSTESVELYHRCTASPVAPGPVLRFLLTDPGSPRSVLRCLNEINDHISRLPPRKLPALACANAAAQVQRGLPHPLSRESFHLHIDGVQLSLEAIHEAVSDAFFVAGQSVLEAAGSS